MTIFYLHGRGDPVGTPLCLAVEEGLRVKLRRPDLQELYTGPFWKQVSTVKAWLHEAQALVAHSWSAHVVLAAVLDGPLRLPPLLLCSVPFLREAEAGRLGYRPPRGRRIRQALLEEPEGQIFATLRSRAIFVGGSRDEQSPPEPVLPALAARGFDVTIVEGAGRGLIDGPEGEGPLAALLERFSARWSP